MLCPNISHGTRAEFAVAFPARQRRLGNDGASPSQQIDVDSIYALRQLTLRRRSSTVLSNCYVKVVCLSNIWSLDEILTSDDTDIREMGLCF